jgi:hypothetical protein
MFSEKNFAGSGRTYRCAALARLAVTALSGGDVAEARSGEWHSVDTI